MKTLVVDDHTMFREVVCKQCRERGFEIAGATGSAAEAIALLSLAPPELIVLDVMLEDGDGFAVAAAAARLPIAPQVLVLCGHVSEYAVMQAERHRVRGFVEKSAQLHVLGEALAAMAGRRPYFSPAFEAMRREVLRDPRAVAKRLSRAEQQLLSPLANGWSNDEIGARSGMKSTTVQTHRSSILRKLQIGGTPRLMAYLKQHGFGLYR